jgi:hypothetical protein
MLVHAFDNTCADIVDFLVQNPGNFWFTTSIESDTLTLSFYSSHPPSNNLADNDSVPSPSYSPINWDEFSLDLDASHTPGLQKAASSGLHPGSQDSAEKLSTDGLDKEFSLNGARSVDQGGGFGATEGESYSDSNRVPQLTKGTTPPCTSLGMHDDFMPNVYLLPDGSYSLGQQSEPMLNAYPSFDASPALGSAMPIMPNTHSSSDASSNAVCIKFPIQHNRVL